MKTSLKRSSKNSALKRKRRQNDKKHVFFLKQIKKHGLKTQFNTIIFSYNTEPVYIQLPFRKTIQRPDQDFLCSRTPLLQLSVDGFRMSARNFAVCHKICFDDPVFRTRNTVGIRRTPRKSDLRIRLSFRIFPGDPLFDFAMEKQQGTTAA